VVYLVVHLVSAKIVLLLLLLLLLFQLLSTR
jgi:hypothetical protein